MLADFSLRDPVLLNTIGHTAGVLLFGFIIALLLRDRRTHGVRDTNLSILAAALALAWNVGSLIALGFGDSDAMAVQVVMTGSFSVLSLLPAVLLQVTLEAQLKTLTVAGYLISAAAIALHFAELFSIGSSPHQLALLLVAGGFDILTIVVVIAKRRIAGGALARREWFSLGCLFLFATSFLHFGYQHFRSPWTAEIAWHHIGIPVALIVLLQDYRFLLLDTFIRFLVNAGLAAVYLVCLLGINRRVHLLELATSGAFIAGLALVSFCLSLILFAYLRNLLQRFIGRSLFHRQNLADCSRAIVQLGGKSFSEEALISGAARQVADHLRAERFAVVTDLPSVGITDQPTTLLPRRAHNDLAADLAWAEAQTPLRFSSGEVRFLLTGPRRGHQRYLSEDMEDMRQLASVIVEQVERFRSEELRRLATQAELRALQAQINPHFLFNAFNTLYGTIDRESLEARRLVLNLTDIFRYFLQGNRTVIALSEELRIIKAYLEIESLRLGDRLTTELEVSDAALRVTIPILSLQPLVENAVKHGVANKVGPGRVIVRAQVEDGLLRVIVEDISFGALSNKSSHEGAGLGLMNVKRRLQLSYGFDSSLDVHRRSHGSIVTIIMPATAKQLSREQEVGLPR